MPQLKGVIKTPTGEPLGGATITLTSLHNRAGILKGVFSHVTTQNGEYNFPVLPGVYSVRLTQSVQRLSEIGVIRVYEDSADGSLNDFLGATDIDLRPESLKKYEELAQQAQQSAEAAAESEQQAGQHADAAARAKEEVKKLAEGVQQNADAVAEGKQQAENLVSQVENAAEEVKKDAEAAKQAASDAEHVREDIDTALSATLKTANRLSELADEGEEAQQESRDNLGLKSAATMTPQSDIRDRTEGCLATPGAFGFGHIFLPAERIRFNTEDDFLSWARNATPGEYFVDGGSKIISGGVLFNGVVSIRWVEARNNPPEPRYTAKVIIFYGINGDIYYNRYWTTGNGYLTGWERLKLGETGIADTLRSIAGRANNYGYPGIGGVVFAAYCINDMDEDGRIFRGSGVSGSRLAAISVTAPYSHNGLSTSTPQIVIAPPSAYPMAGTFVALSGEPTTKVSAGTSITGLFVRIM
ncbi:phage tail protein [Escherichia coli]|uniref:prophage tail fiber N-terminal domain-containing protein n=1 Tax=Escherichia coli TaxID=562 RepID=UPI000F9DE926|nr:prophage tail fiber N-terminal domain-containing protein [Escherichia coli]EKG6903676.1 prophage tail fiber N-terminal domain-containing protein [Escherichia coli]ELA3937779.1 prophage tail fiber N-terminal domain-containing protein [Escherichia coli]MCW3438355.1 prophage tail fiber N-terminal domain-containing protein [Escherichia coli]MEB8253393.1 prophage tail fiber N-terminal domain-containing protein [Escherichia coli]MGH54431.1 phage tail protein [Escherichia coli]